MGEVMASASVSCSKTPSDIRRLRAARLNFEAPSFSLGIDTDAFRSIPSFAEFAENASGIGKDDRNSLRLSPPDDEVVVNSSGRGEEEKKDCKVVEKFVVSDSEEDDVQITGSQQQRSFKRLKRGPSSAGKQPSQGARDLSRGTDFSAPARRLSKDQGEFSTQLQNGKCDSSRKTDTSARRKGKDLSIFSTQLFKEPLPLVKDCRNQAQEGLKGAGTECINSRQENVQTYSGDRFLSSTREHRSGQKRSEPEPSLGSRENAQCSREVPKFGFQRESGSTEGGLSFNREPLSSSQIGRNNRTNLSVNTQPSSRGDVDLDEDDIEEFSDDEQFGFGSRTQRPSRRSLRGQMSGQSPILLSSSPETSEKPVLHIPGADLPLNAPLRLSQPTETTQPTIAERTNIEEDPFLIDDFGSGSGWRLTKPDLSKPARTPQQLNSPMSESQRAKASLRFAQPTEPITSEMTNSEEDPFLIDDFVSGSGWRRTKPDLSRPAQTPQQRNNSTSESQRANSVPNQFKTSQRDLFRDSNVISMYTETPARRDTVGPSQAHNAEGSLTEEDRIRAFLRQRFPHFKPVDDLLVDGGLDNEPVYIDYRRQFAEGRDSTNFQSGNSSMGGATSWSPVRNINGAFSAFSPSIRAQRGNPGKKRAKSKKQPNKSNPGTASSSGGRKSRPAKRGPGGSGEGQWRTVNGSRVYFVGNQRLSGQGAYVAYKRRSGNSSKKKSRKRQLTKSK
ncbi:unnamed protein product [Calypogeia fissa]